MHQYVEILLFLVYVFAFVLAYMGLCILPGWILHRKGVSDAVSITTMIVLGFLALPGMVLLMMSIGNRLFPGIDS